MQTKIVIDINAINLIKSVICHFLWIHASIDTYILYFVFMASSNDQSKSPNNHNRNFIKEFPIQNKSSLEYELDGNMK